MKLFLAKRTLGFILLRKREAEKMNIARLNAKDRNEAAESLSDFLKGLSAGTKISVYGAGRDYAFFLDTVPSLKSFIGDIIDDSGAAGTIPYICVASVLWARQGLIKEA